MKYALILPDGAADRPVEAFDGLTPLEMARTPHLDAIAAMGRVGRVRTVPRGFTPGSDVATLSVVGYNPEKYYTGRAPLEAIAQRISLGPDELVFRCNLVTIVDGRMEDYSAGHIRQAEAERLIADLQARLGDERVSFHCGVSYRHLVKIRQAEGIRVKCTPPHDILGQEVAGYYPSGKGSELLRRLMEQAGEVLAGHEVNQVRADLGENPATSIWLWGQGALPRLPSFKERYGVQGAAITAVDLIRGIALLIGWRLIEVEGATGDLHTNYAGKGAAAVEALDDVDMIVVHIEAPDEAGHMGDPVEKLRAIERVDEHIVGPVLEKIRGFDEWRILCLPDHPTPVALRTHTDDPVPFCMAGTGVARDKATRFGETAGAESDLSIDPGHELMEFFLKS